MRFESFHILLSAELEKEADRYAPWVEATNVALDILKTVDVENIRKPSLLNILAQRNDPNEVPISHGSDGSVRKPDVVFMTEEELIKVHNINKAAPHWRTTLKKRCQARLPSHTVGWRQFKATVEFKRHKKIGDPILVTFPEELQSCREGTDSFVKPQSLHESVPHVDDAPAPPGPEPEEADQDPVPKACTFCFHSFYFQVLTRFSYKPAARNGSKAVMTHAISRDE
jgi:hypothetical protein